MKHLYMITLLLLSSSLFGVSTRFINDFNFNKLSSYQLSNVSLVEGAGLTLSRDSEQVFQSESILWSMALYNSKILIGTGDKAAVIEISGSGSREVFVSEGDLILSDIETKGQDLYLSTLPNSRILKLKSDYTISQEWSVTNKYVWDLVRGGEELFILCGNPAAVYSISGGMLTSIVDVPEEQNLLSGLYYQKSLYFAGESILYRYNGDKVMALAAFDNPISGILQHKGDIYLITSTHDPAVSSGPNGNGKKSSNGNSSSSRNNSYQGESALYKISLDGNVQMLYKKKNIQFVALARMGDDLIIGTGKDAGYLSYSLSLDRQSFSSLGQGKFITMVENQGDIYGVMLYPSRVVKIKKDYHKQGVFTSDIIDTENISYWGQAQLSLELMPGSDYSISTRTGLVKNVDLWERWKPLKDKIGSAPGRYIQYKISLESQGKNTPLIQGLTIPFLQKNIAPRITEIKVQYDKKGVEIEWDADDVNKDKLNYDIYLSLQEKEWVKLNKYPLAEDSYHLSYQSYPQGRYRVKVVVRDDWSNPAHYSLDAYKVTEFFILDNQAPRILDIKKDISHGRAKISFSALDSLLPLSWTAYSVNGGIWKSLQPLDEIMDQKRENFEIIVSQNGPLFIQILVRDSVGNETTEGIYLP